MILIGVLLLLTTLLLLWAAFIRKRRRRQRLHHYSHRHSAGAAPAEAPNDLPAGRRKHRKWRHRRREHRPRNPTLAETGGLPPFRSDEPPNPLR